MHDPMTFSKAGHPSRTLAMALTWIALLLLPSCAIPPLRRAEPGPDLPADVIDGAITEENSAQLGIEEFFNDPILVSLIDLGLVNNRELKILNEEVQIASNDILARRGAYLPFVTFEARSGLEKPSLFTPLGAAEEQLEFLPGRHFPDPLPNFLGGINLFWPMDIWRELRNAQAAAEQRYMAAVEQRNFFVTRLIADIAENYYRLMALDMRQKTLDETIELQSQSLQITEAKKAAGRGTELAVQRFQAEVRKNQSEKLIVTQDIVEVENRINFLLNRFPQPVERDSTGFFDLNTPLSVGVPSQLLQYRPDIRQAEREVAAAGLDVMVARAQFFPRVDITAGIGYEAFSPKYLFRTPDALIYNFAGNLVAPLINKKAIQAEYCSANARQIESIYNYQRIVLEAFTEVVNYVSMVHNFSTSIELKKQQLQALDESVESANNLFQNARVEYVEVLLAQRDLLEARTVLIEIKEQQLSAIVNAYQALGGGDLARMSARQQQCVIGTAHQHVSDDSAKSSEKKDTELPKPNSEPIRLPSPR